MDLVADAKTSKTYTTTMFKGIFDSSVEIVQAADNKKDKNGKQSYSKPVVVRLTIKHDQHHLVYSDDTDAVYYHSPHTQECFFFAMMLARC